MFRNERRRGATGLGGIIAVALIVAAYLATAGLMVKSFTDGGETAGVNAKCVLVC